MRRVELGSLVHTARIAMFEPMKLITAFLAILLLAPLGFVFWRITIYQPRPEAQRRAELDASLQEHQVGVEKEDGSFVGGVVVTSVEAIGFSESTARWLSFYPHRWVGIVGLVAIGVIVACLLVSLFYTGGLAVSAERWSSPRP
jgi:hypothetical protein